MARGRCICISEWVSVVISTQSLTAWQACCLCSASLGFSFFIYLFSIKTLRNQALLNNTANYHNANTALAPSSMSSLYVTNCICHSSHTPTNPPQHPPAPVLFRALSLPLWHPTAVASLSDVGWCVTRSGGTSVQRDFPQALLHHTNPPTSTTPRVRLHHPGPWPAFRPHSMSERPLIMLPNTSFLFWELCTLLSLTPPLLQTR